MGAIRAQLRLNETTAKLKQLVDSAESCVATAAPALLSPARLRRDALRPLLSHCSAEITAEITGLPHIGSHRPPSYRLSPASLI